MAESVEMPAERRGAQRAAASFLVLLDGLETAVVNVEAANISAAGMLVRSTQDLPVWARLSATLPAIGARELRVLRREHDAYGCLFQVPLTGGELDAIRSVELTGSDGQTAVIAPAGDAVRGPRHPAR